MGEHVMKKLSIAAYIIFSSASAIAGSVAGTGGSTEVTQILNNAELMNQTNEMYEQTVKLRNQLQRQTDMLNDMNRNSQVLTSQQWSRTQDDLQKLSDVVRKGEAIAYSSANLDEIYRQKYKGYEEYSRNNAGPINYSDRYSEWSQTNRDSVVGAMKSANLQQSQFQGEQSTMQAIETMGRSSKGRMEALQVGNMIAAHQVSQMQKLRELVMAQMQMQASYQTFEANQKDSAKAKSVEFFKVDLSKINVQDGDKF